MLPAGRLNKRISIEAPADPPVQTASGAVQKTWVPFATVWASFEPLSGKEIFAAQQYSSEATHRVTIRYRAGLTSKMRIKLGTRAFDILSEMNEMERNQDIVMICQEGLSKGN